MFTWFENTEKTTRLTGNPKEKIITTSHKTSSSSQRATTTVKTSISSTTKNNVNNKTSKSQLSKGSPQGHGKLMKDSVQVHNRYGHLDDSEEESVWNLPPDDSPSPMDGSPSKRGDLRADLQREVRGKDPNGRKAFPRPDTHDGSDHPMELSRSKC